MAKQMSPTQPAFKAGVVTLLQISTAFMYLSVFRLRSPMVCAAAGPNDPLRLAGENGRQKGRQQRVRQGRGSCRALFWSHFWRPLSRKATVARIIGFPTSGCGAVGQVPPRSGQGVATSCRKDCSLVGSGWTQAKTAQLDVGSSKIEVRLACGDPPMWVWSGVGDFFSDDNRRQESCR